MPKKKIKWEISVETDADLKEGQKLYKFSCERCRNANRQIAKTCWDCICSKNHCNFKLKKGEE